MVTGLDCYKLYGDPYTTFDEGKYLTVWNLPKYITDCITCLPIKIYCNKEMIVPLEISFLNIINRGLLSEFKTFNGCFNVRPIRGYENTVKKLMEADEYDKAMIYMSIHSWGVAIDINAKENSLGKKPKMSKEFVKCFEDAGFEWGGNWKRFDGMHFQLSYLR